MEPDMDLLHTLWVLAVFLVFCALLQFLTPVKIVTVAVKLPTQGLGDLIARMRIAGFRFESERGETTVFKQAALAAFLQGGLAQRLLMVTNTADGLVFVGRSKAIDKLLPVLGAAVLSKQ
jgi:hypothetical protein